MFPQILTICTFPRTCMPIDNQPRHRSKTSTLRYQTPTFRVPQWESCQSTYTRIIILIPYYEPQRLSGSVDRTSPSFTPKQRFYGKFTSISGRSSPSEPASVDPPTSVHHLTSFSTFAPSGSRSLPTIFGLYAHLQRGSQILPGTALTHNALSPPAKHKTIASSPQKSSITRRSPDQFPLEIVGLNRNFIQNSERR